MEGVEILNQFEVAIDFQLNGTAFWVVFVFINIALIVVGMLLWLVDGCDFNVVILMGVVGILIGTILGLIAGESFEIATEYETHYQVIITDEVKMTEFNEQYEILDQEGKIYTVREKIK